MRKAKKQKKTIKWNITYNDFDCLDVRLKFRKGLMELASHLMKPISQKQG